MSIKLLDQVHDAVKDIKIQGGGTVYKTKIQPFFFKYGLIITLLLVVVLFVSHC